MICARTDSDFVCGARSGTSCLGFARTSPMTDSLAYCSHPYQSSSSKGDVTRAAVLGPIPSRLKCAICSRLANDPRRLPCCEKSICTECRAAPSDALVLIGVGHASLPNTCPLCEHHPLRQDDCKENLPLRKTIQVFLRHAADKAATVAAQVSFPTLPSCAQLTPFRPPKSYEAE